MNCNETRAVLDGYLDRELDLVTSLEVQRHLQTCDGCARIHENRQALQASLRGASLYRRAPAGLESRVLAAAREAERADRAADKAVEASAPPRDRPARRQFWGPLRARLALAASLALAALLGGGVGRLTSVPLTEDRLAQEVFASDVRSLMAVNRGVEVVSSDRHTVKPWFAGKLDFSPPVQDFAAQGYPLVGGRRDYAGGRPVAVLVYKRHAHWINLFLWPSPGESAPQVETRQGYHLIHWARGGMTYWAVSDAGAAELEDFVRLIQSEA